ncbi:MAG: AAA family ATPase [Pyrinomonadaceae bacterium]|nr:AAA family ATPase [Pyrinomonadaceae bacterium]
MTQPLSIIVLGTDLNTFKEVRTALTSDTRVQLLAGGDDAEQLYGEIVRLKPSAAIITIGANPEPAIKLIKNLSSEAPKTAIISAARNASSDVLLQSLRAGAREFLPLPIRAEELKTVLDRIGEFCNAQVETPKKKGRMIAVFSSKGGCGTSFLATNIAGCLGARTALVDLNLQAGDLPLFLGVDPKYSFADMAEKRDRLDDALIKSFITPYSSTLSLVAAPREADSADEIEPEHVFDVLQKLRESYDYVVLDPQHTFDSITLAALDQSDEVILVLTLDIPAIRSTQRALEIFDRLGYPRKKVRIVVNRWSKMIDLDLRQVEKFLGEPVIGFVPSDYQTAVTSINLGRPLVHSDPNSKIALEIRRIARTLTGGGPMPIMEEPKTKKTLWNTFFKRELEFQASMEKV